MAQHLTIRLMTYNVLDGGVGREAAINEVIRAATPEVVVVQEVTQAVVSESIAERLGMKHCLAQGREQHVKVGLLSHLPILASHSHRLSRVGAQCLEATIQLTDSQVLTLYGLHLMPFYPWFFEWWRVRQIRNLLLHIHRAAPGPHLLAGDFNAIAPGDTPLLDAAPVFVRAQLWFQMGFILRHALKLLLDAGYVDCFRALHPHENGLTLPSPNPTVRLDYIFADQLLANYLRKCRVLAQPESVKIASDHLPVLAEFVWVTK